MNLQQSPTINIGRPDVHDNSETLLQGRWLLIARVAWIGVTLLVLTLNVVMIPRYYSVLLTSCNPGLQCFAISLNAYDRLLLHQFGLSLNFVAAYQVMLDAISVLLCCALSALIFWRKSADRMALFCAFMLVLFGGAGFTNILSETLVPLSTAWVVLIGILDLLGQCSFGIFFFLFPSGRFVPSWTRWIVPFSVLYWIYHIFIQNSSSQFSWSILVFFVLLLCIVGTQVYRYRRVSTLRERQQTKWVIFGISTGLLGFILALIVGNVFLGPALHQSSIVKTLIGGTAVYGFLLLIPISIAIAILRSRLYDIDVIINKALVYGLLTALLAAVYAGLIIGLESLVGLISEQSTQPLVIVASTLVIYALFWPLRRRIQQIIDRRFYRRKYDAARTLESFSATLRQEVDLSTLSKHLVEVVQETMQPASVSLWLRPPAQQQIPWRATPSIPSESEARDEM